MNTPGTVSEGNVIYANFRSRSRIKDEEAPAAEAVTRRDAGSHLNPAAARLMSIIEAQADQGRISRGRTYAKAGNVIELDVKTGAAHARVAGSQNEPFSVAMILPYSRGVELEDLMNYFISTKGSLARARTGDFDKQVLDLVLGEDPHDVRFSCTCPDHVSPCKHAVALVQRLAERVDADPGVLVQLRGVTFEVLESAALAHARSKAGGAEADTTETFWSGGELPDVPQPTLAPALNDSDTDLLHKAMRTVSFTSIDQIRGVSDIEDMFDYLTR